eukprot:m.340891 g.340891  ORF g.340891 m.340891 type:complete len:383 (+) comp19621_c0_seq1:197-1345(+)
MIDKQITALLFAVGGGISMGFYPLFIKTPAVLKASPHPVVFQLYKSTMVFLTGFLFLIPRYLRDKDHDAPLYVFTYWGIVSAAAWIPSGLCTIFSVPMIGMGMNVAITSATASVLSFLVFWLVFDSEMKSHSCGKGCTYYRAPIYLSTTVLGMVGMIFAEPVTATLFRSRQENAKLKEKAPLLVNDSPVKEPVKKSQTVPVGSFKYWLGIFMSIVGGVFAATQYAVVTLGKRYEQTNAGCYSKHNKTIEKECPPDIVEAFDDFGSWMVSFGIGAIIVTLGIYFLCAMLYGEFLNLHFSTLKTAGVAAGSCWSIGNFGCTAAVVMGGNAVILAQNMSSVIICSGFLGMFWYKEMSRLDTRLVWGILAAITMASMILLGLEKVT